MSRHDVEVHREGEWWVIEVPGIGITQARRLDKVQDMARDLVAALRDEPLDDVVVDVHFILAPEIQVALTTARAAAEAARIAQQAAASSAREAATRMQEQGWSLRDVARLTGLSFQRVHQLLRERIPEGSPPVDVRVEDKSVDMLIGALRHRGTARPMYGLASHEFFGAPTCLRLTLGEASKLESAWSASESEIAMPTSTHRK